MAILKHSYLNHCLFSFSMLMKGLKCYLRYKMITSQNVSSEAQVKILFHKKVMFHSQDIQVFVFLIIRRFRKSVMPWWVLVHRGHFWISFEPHVIKLTKLGQLIDISKGNNFEKSFEQFGWLGLDSRPFLI